MTSSSFLVLTSWGPCPTPVTPLGSCWGGAKLAMIALRCVWWEEGGLWVQMGIGVQRMNVTEDEESVGDSDSREGVPPTSDDATKN